MRDLNLGVEASEDILKAVNILTLFHTEEGMRYYLNLPHHDAVLHNISKDRAYEIITAYVDKLSRVERVLLGLKEYPEENEL